ncbi:MAG: hypothetical protein HW421_1951 [Ignavibacteria bacterium]|nr:hypothetical protein [Ignavibacteria bacterium]
MRMTRTQFFRTLAIILFIAIAGLTGVKAQPTNYCNTCAATSCPPGYTYSYVWCYPYSYGWTYHVVMKEVGGSTVLSRVTSPTEGYINQPIPVDQGYDGNGYFFVNDREVMISMGNSYQLDVGTHLWYNWGYYSQRIWIDWNQNGSFLDAGERINPSQWSYYDPNVYNCPIKSYYFTVPATAPPGKTRMRIISAYYMYDYGPCYNGYSYLYYPYYCYNYGYYGECEDYIINVGGGIKDMFPFMGDILYANELYDGTTRLKNGIMQYFERPYLTLTNPQPTGSMGYYKIVGPLPNTSDTVYRATATTTPYSDFFDVGGTSSMTYTINRSTGSYTNPQPTGNGAFIGSKGGEYKGIAGISGKPTIKINVFTVSYDNDLAVVDITSPRTNLSPKFYKYNRGQVIDLKAVVQNTGLNPVYEFNLTCNIYNSSNTRIYTNSYHFLSTVPLTKSQKTEISIGTWKTQTVGIYRTEFITELLSANDQETFNDRLPRQTDANYTFQVQYEFEASANKIVIPAQDTVLFGSRPFTPSAYFKNNGISDLSNIAVRMIISRDFGNYGIVYNPPNEMVEDIQSGMYNTRRYNFKTKCVLKESGRYKVCIIISHPEDPVPENDTLCAFFYINAGLRGTYTVGTGGNFLTIDSVMNALYYRGLSGPVTFQLINPTYTLTSPNPMHPAWEFTSTIIGLGWNADERINNTITWTPGTDLAATRGGVTINLNSTNGVGVYLGQSTNPINPYALYNDITAQNKTIHDANNQGFITFDGGSQKALRFVLNSTNSNHGSVIYLGVGSTNNAVKNCLIENGTPALANKIWLPLVKFYAGSSQFVFEQDSLVATIKDGYSAGIVNRSYHLNIDSFPLQPDTLPNMNNVISGNVISGFGYGIVDMGIGVLYIQLPLLGLPRFDKFYNQGTVISKNTIYNCARAGIVMGYNENSEISFNRIYNIGNGTNDAAGIMLGGQTKIFQIDTLPGYNVIGTKVIGNEISSITSPLWVEGIRIEQVQQIYPRPEGGIIKFPVGSENLFIMSNSVWGLKPTDPAAMVCGIHIYTARKVEGDIVYPKRIDYFTRNDRIINNTVIIENDQLDNTGYIAGVALQQVRGTILKNNAILYKDPLNTNNNDVAAAVLLHTFMPGNGSFTADRNAFYVGPLNSEIADVYRFVETDTMSKILEAGARGEYKRLYQWQSWTLQDQNSVTGNFGNNFTKTGSNPQNLRITTVPELPVGSILNNRGERISAVNVDIDNNPRGVAGKLYDIGAYEFNGGMYVYDLEALSFPAPATYRSSGGNFSDAEYIMTVAPIEIKANIRNNGTLKQAGVNCILNIYQENADGSFATIPFMTDTQKIELNSMQSMEIAFKLADGIGNEFYPKTYSDLIKTNSAYTYANRSTKSFQKMECNVTPRYRIRVSMPSDQQSANNIIEKDLRFYLIRSKLSLISSGENTLTDIYTGFPTSDQMAGRLNYDSLNLILNRVGITNNPTNDNYLIDYFDRNEWERKAVNYTPYKNMFWADGHDKALTRYEIIDINNFLNTPVGTEKKDLVIASQEMLRLNQTPDSVFTQTVLRAKRISKYPTAPPVDGDEDNPLSNGVSNDGNTINGVKVCAATANIVKSTIVAGDMPPLCALMQPINTGNGISYPAFFYNSHTFTPKDSIMGIATTTLNSNIIYFGVDWRHFSDVESLIRGTMDFLVRYGGAIPVELSDFNAVSHGKKVDIYWSTATEMNSARFEIEKADFTNSGNSQFQLIQSVPAAGTSKEIKEYGPFTDYAVEFGNQYSYRLKMIDLDGSFKYSNEKVVSITGTEGGIQIGTATPNPAVSKVSFELQLDNEMNLTAEIFDISGKKTATVFDGRLHSGQNKIETDVKDYVNGAYTLIIKSGDIVITRKFTVLK